MAITDTPPKRSFWLSMRGFFAALGALVTTGVAIVGLFLPSKHDSSMPTSVVVAASPATSPAAPPPPPPPASAPAPTALAGAFTDVQRVTMAPCCTFNVQVEATGFNGQETAISTILIDELDGSEVDGAVPIGFTPAADVDRARTDVEVPISEAGTYGVRFILSDPDGNELDRFVTEPIEVS